MYNIPTWNKNNFPPNSLKYYIQVNGVYLSSADHELAVQAIQRSGNPIRFIVQSLQHMVSIEDNYVECRDP